VNFTSCIFCPSGLQIQRQTHQSGLLSQSGGGVEKAPTGCRLTEEEEEEEPHCRTLQDEDSSSPNLDILASFP